MEKLILHYANCGSTYMLYGQDNTRTKVHVILIDDFMILYKCKQGTWNLEAKKTASSSLNVTVLNYDAHKDF